MPQKRSEAQRARYRATARAYKVAHREEVRAKERAYKAAHKAETAASRLTYNRAYKTAHRKELAAKQRIYAAAHKEEIVTYARAYYLAHKKEIAARIRAYAVAYPEMVATQRHRRRARKANAPLNDLTHLQWVEIQAAQKHLCYYCGKRCKGKLTQDHITPLSQGGSHTLHNVIGACQSCNSKKYVGTPLQPVQPMLLTVAASRTVRSKAQ